VAYYEAQLEKHGVELKLGTRADAAAIEACGAEVAVIASGAKPKALGEDWEKLDMVFDAWQALSGEVAPGRKVVIVGGGRWGWRPPSPFLTTATR
jgi:2,4-dienoyl-CoA reductase (NADPH2)